MHHEAYLSSMISPVLVGRDAQIAAVERLLRTVAAGQAAPRVLLIQGEAGIGKSRLLAALKERAVTPAWRCVESTCFEQYQGVPYAPLIDLLRGSAGSVDELVEALGPEADVLELLPELAGTRRHQVAEQRRELHDPAQEQRRLFSALASWFAKSAGKAPLLLIVEDLHWSDTASLTFLPILVRTLASLPALLVVTLRGEEASPSLRAALAELNRQRLAAEISLSRLSREEVGTMVAACFQLGRPVHPDFLDTLYDLTEGNPFFIEEVLTSLVSAGDIFYADGTWDRKPLDQLQIPQSIQEAVFRRTALLSQAAREVLTLAAALGRRFNFALLQQTTGHDEATLLALIKELIAVQVVFEESEDQFAFRHALGRAAVYNSLLARERRVLHRRLAEALEQAGSTVYLADLAQHFAEAQVWDKALRYAEAAAQAAWRAYAPREVIVHLTGALEAAQHLPGIARAPLLHLRGQAYATLDSFAAAQADYQEALADARLGGRSTDEWQALLDLGFLWSSRDYVRAGDYFERMLVSARTLGDPARLAHSLNRVGNWHMNHDRPHTARQAHAEAFSIFTQLGDEHGLAETLDLLGISCYLCGDLAQGTAHFNQAIALFTAQDNRHGLINCLVHLGLRAEFDIEVLDFEHLGARSGSLERAVALAQEIGWRAGEAFALMTMGSHLLGRGDYGRALASLERAQAIASEIEHQSWALQTHAALGLLYLDLLHPVQAAEQLTEAMSLARAMSSVLMMRTIARYLAAAFMQQQRFDEAEEVLHQAAAPGGDVPEPSLITRQLRLAGAELALMRGEPERALEEIDALITSTANLGAHVIPRLWLVRGTAYSALRRYDAARETISAALAAAQAQGRRPLAWRAQAALVGVAMGQRRREEAQAAALAARALVDELARTLDEGELRQSFQAHADAAIPNPAVLTPRQALKQTFDGLTDRELEVARLIARGYTNRQIAVTLTLSERTVSTHIGNIYGKLGFNARAQLTRWAIEKGIISA